MLLFAGIAAALVGCTADTPPNDRDPTYGAVTDTSPPDSLELVEASIPPAIAGQGGWNFQQRAEADLAGDGEAEQIVLTAQVELSRGRPAWDDGQPWQVYIEEPDGSQTRVYARRLQLGTLTMRLTRGEPGRPPTIILLEHLPERLSVYEVSYHGPDRVSVVQRFERHLDPTGELASPRLP